MRAAFLESIGQLVIKDIEAPRITRPDEVLIQVKVVGVCGSEVHAFEGTHPYRNAPVVLGHEAAGIVTAVGEGVTEFKPGDRVLVDPQWTCGECEHCQAGDINLCLTKKVLGTQVWPGAFGEYITAPQEAVFHLPETLSFAQGSLIEPLTVAVHLADRAGFAPGKSVVVLGSGSIGGMVCAAARAYGAGPIIAADIRQHCLDAARERMGATHDFLLPDPDFTAKVKELTGGRGADIVVVAADEIELVDLALDLIRKRGTIVLVALLTAEPLRFIGFKVIIKEAHLIGSTMSNASDVRRAIELAASGAVDVMGIATHTLPIEEAQRGMEMAHEKTDSAIKVLLEF
jgi:2-desacetyl-2-hydroxyethyl bacteriochlorophyllide A dehydrogenase